MSSIKQIQDLVFTNCLSNNRKDDYLLMNFKIKQRSIIIRLVQGLPQFMISIDAKKERCSLDQEIYSLQNPQRKITILRYRRADDCLSEQYVPNEILCRNQQIEKIKQFVLQFVREGKAKQSLYIAGVPGIGKTLSVNKALADLVNEREQFKKSDKCKVKIVKMNAMKLKHPTDIYKNLYLELCNSIDIKKKKISPHNALITLDGIFRKNQLSDEDARLSILKKVVVIDQIDHLKTKDEDVLYNLFDWTQSEHSKLAIIAISNTIHFPELLKPKICSRIGNRRLTFKPYESQELQKILNQRVEQSQVFDKHVISFISKKIAKSTNDIRRCFHILKQAIFLHLQTKNCDSKNSKISLETVSKAYDNFYMSPITTCYRSMPNKYKKILVLLAQHFQRETRSMTFEVLSSNANSKFKIDEATTKYIVISLMEMEVVEVKNHVNRNSYPSKFQNEWNIRLLLQSDKILHASLKYDTEQIV